MQQKLNPLVERDGERQFCSSLEEEEGEEEEEEEDVFCKIFRQISASNVCFELKFGTSPIVSGPVQADSAESR